MKILISRSSAVVKLDQSFGPITIHVKKEGQANYSMIWNNKMKQATTSCLKVNKKLYMIQSQTPQTPNVEMQAGKLKDALMLFFTNCSTTKVEAAMIGKARKWLAELIRKFENVTFLDINLADVPKSQAQLHLPVFIGANKEKKGILLSIIPFSTKSQVLMLNEDGSQGNVLEIPSDQVWIE